MENVIKHKEHLASIPYSHCDTRIVGLQELSLPEMASEEEYRAIYHNYTTSPEQNCNSNALLLRSAVESIRHGIAPPVAFPTETVYGLGADATNAPTISGIFAAKGRPSDNPLIVHVGSVAHLERLTGTPLPAIYRSLTAKFWPGPLTILLPVPKSEIFARNVHPGQETIGFRIPASKYARFFIAATDRPIAGPSANSSGKPSPTTAQHVLDDLRGKINFILDGGACDVGVESTVVDGLHDPPLVLRPGGVSLAELRRHGRECGNKFADTAVGYKRHQGHRDGNSSSSSTPQSNGESEHSAFGSASEDTGMNPRYEEDMTGAPRAPGMKYRHYAPKGRLVLFSEQAVSQGPRVQAKLDELIAQSSASLPGEVRVGIISCHWPPFAGLHASSAEADTPPVISTSVYESITSIATIPPNSQRSTVTLYNVQIGPEIATLAHSLFGVLRLFDELDCAFILAETVRRSDSATVDGGSGTGQTVQDLEDAVIDRIEKAAAERVD